MNTACVDTHKEIIRENLSGFFEGQLVENPDGLLEQLKRNNDSRRST